MPITLINPDFYERVMKFLEACKVFERIEKTRSTIEMRHILSGLFSKLSSEEASVISNLLEGQLGPAYEGVVLGMAEKTVLNAIAEAYGISKEKTLASMKKVGDAGSIAEALANSKGGKLSLIEAYSGLSKISQSIGGGSAEEKRKLLCEMLSKCSGIEARYISRIAVGKLRLGLGTMIILDALAIAYLGDVKERPLIESAYNICPDIGLIASIACAKGIKGVNSIKVKPGRPIKMMLASRVKNVSEIMESMGKAIVEEKYDGERIQAHFDGKKLVLFSRRMDVITDQFPDVVDGLKRSVKARSYIIEGECCAVGTGGRLEPFQKLMQRRRKYDIREYSLKVPVTLFLFDILFLNGKQVLDKPFVERREMLERIIKARSKNITMARNITASKTSELESYFKLSLSRGCEGIIAKKAIGKSPYQAGVRGALWIKWKPEYAKDLQDTFDLVVVGGYYGRGKRKGVFGALLCATYNPRSEMFETVCKLGSGFSDIELKELTAKLLKTRIVDMARDVNVAASMKPDVWFAPTYVLEVLGAEITTSPNHTCFAKQGKGLAIRFPRFVRWRPDKKPEQATTSKEINEMSRGK